MSHFNLHMPIVVFSDEQRQERTMVTLCTIFSLSVFTNESHFAFSFSIAPCKLFRKVLQPSLQNDMHQITVINKYLATTVYAFKSLPP